MKSKPCVCVCCYMRGEQSVLGGWMDIIHLVCREREREDKWWEGSVKRFGPSVWSWLGFALAQQTAQCVYRCILCFIFLPFLFRLKCDSDQGLYHQLTSLCTIIIIKWADNQIQVLSLSLLITISASSKYLSHNSSLASA